MTELVSRRSTARAKIGRNEQCPCRTDLKSKPCRGLVGRRTQCLRFGASKLVSANSLNKLKRCGGNCGERSTAHYGACGARCCLIAVARVGICLANSFVSATMGCWRELPRASHQ
jgi:hypothetical protein